MMPASNIIGPRDSNGDLVALLLDIASSNREMAALLRIQEGCCFACINCLNPKRWENIESSTRAEHIAVSRYNVMYLKEKFPKYVLNPCPPCLCCVEAMYREDFAPKVRKLIPFEKITDIEVHEAGSNELVPPGCNCPPQCNPISIEVPVSKTMINTAGSQGPELIIEGIHNADGFRRFVMDLKRGAGPRQAPGQQEMVMAPNIIGAADSNGDVVALLRDIASSNREIAALLRSK